MSCPHCGTALAAECKYCAACGRRAVDFLFCPKCDEPASIRAACCPHCGQKIPNPDRRELEALDIEVEVTHLGAFCAGGNVTGLFFPPVIRIHGGRISMTKWSLLGLRVHEQEIQLCRVASVRYTQGIIWAALLVETFGGASEDLVEKGFRQEDARRIATQLKACLQDEG